MNSADVLISGLKAGISIELSEQDKKVITKKCTQLKDKVIVRSGDNKQLSQILEGYNLILNLSV